MELSRQISELVARFVARVTDLARELAQDQLTSALVDEHDLPSRSTTASPRRLPGPPGRRPPEELEAVRRRLLAYIEAHPGQRIEEIARALSTTTRELGAPLKKLLFGDLVRAEGERRATRYWPVAAAPTDAARPTARKPTTERKLGRKPARRSAERGRVRAPNADTAAAAASAPATSPAVELDSAASGHEPPSA